MKVWYSLSAHLSHCDSHIEEGRTDESCKITSNETSGVDWEIPPSEIANRLDLRDLCIFTIDPSGARDLDDALHICALPTPEGNEQSCQFEVGVHIADVSYFLAPETELDAEARHRATSVYLVQKVVPMLPAILCEELCSLNPDKDRLAFSCIFRLTADGSLVEGHKPWFGRTVIRSCAKLDYATAQRMVDGIIPSKPHQDSNESTTQPNEDAHINALPNDVWEFSRRPSGIRQDIRTACDGAGPSALGKTPHHAGWTVARDVCMLHRIAMARRGRRMSNGALSLSR